MDFTHFNEMVKSKNGRRRMRMKLKELLLQEDLYVWKETLIKVKDGHMKKGDVLAVVLKLLNYGAKKTSEVIPMCHNILIDGVDLRFEFDEENSAIHIEAEAKTTGKTGIEMEALTVSKAALTIYDMCKAIDKEMVIDNIRLVKTGGKSVEFLRSGEEI